MQAYDIHLLIIGLSFERPYLIRGLNLTVADPGFPIGGADLVGGTPTPEAAMFRKICMSK